MAVKSVLFTVFFILILSIRAFAQDDGDWQIWNSVSAEKSLNEDVRMTLEEETRFGDDFNRFIYQAFDIGLVRSATDWLDLGFNFRYMIEDDAGHWEHESRPHFNAILKYISQNLELFNRSRFEYRYMTRTKDTWRYRNLSAVKLPLNWTRLKISPNIKEEIFVNFDQDDLNENRLSGGLEFKLLKGWDGEIFYLRKSYEYRSKWTQTNVIGVKVKFSF